MTTRKFKITYVAHIYGSHYISPGQAVMWRVLLCLCSIQFTKSSMVAMCPTCTIWAAILKEVRA